MQNLQQHFKLERVVIVADNGLNSKLNLKELKDAGFAYIVSCGVKNLAAKIQQQVLSQSGYQEVALKQVFDHSEAEDNGSDDTHLFKYKLLDYRNTLRDKDEVQGKTVTLNSMEFSVLDIENEPYYLKGKHLALASKIFSVLRLKQPKNIMAEQQAREYLPC